MRLSIAIVLVAVTPWAKTCAQEAGAGRFLRWGLSDAGTFATTALPHLPFAAATGYASVQLLAGIDPNIYDAFRRDDPAKRWSPLEVINDLGGPQTAIPVAGVFALTLLTDNKQLQDAAFTSAESIVFAGIIAYSLKYVLGRARPEDSLGARHFDPFFGHTSFPSGHATTAFAIATPWAMYYPGAPRYILLTLASGTAAARVIRGRHWPSDVVAGSVIGYLTGRWLSKRHMANSRPAAVTPVIGSDGLGLYVKVRF